MAELIVKYPDRAAEHFQISRLRVTIGRSARNDLCIPDPFASRVHAEVRNEGDEYFLQDLGSANGTLYNGSVVESAVTLTRGGRIQIGETEIVFNDSAFPLSSGATMITDNSSSIPEATIALSSADRTTSGAQADPRFMGGTVMLQGVRSVLAVPLGVGANVFGIIYADSPLSDNRFTEDHLKVLTTLASVAAIRVENARLTEEQMERERLEREQQVASEIQQRFLPAAAPQIEGYELQGISFPCYEIGGDYYDFIQRENGKMIVALGDVSGKGTAAALLMSSLHAAVHAHAETHDSIAAAISAVNRYLVESIPPNRFVTLFYAELDPKAGSLAFLNAGHNPPLIVHSGGTMEQLAAGGLPLGIMSDAEFREGHTQLHPGDVLVIYSDGVSEAVNPSGEEFGRTRLYEVVARNLDASAGGIRDRIESALTKFCQGTPAADDITLVICKRLAEAAETSAAATS